MKGQFACLLLLATVCVGVASVCLFARADETSPAAAPPARALPVSKLFDFSHYQELFKKSYATLSEQIARKKLFLARAFRVFIAAIGFKHHKKDYYLAINERSDWTPEEVKKSYVSYANMRANIPELERDRLVVDEDENENGQADLLPVADEAEIAQALDELAKEANRTPGALEISQELSRLSDGSKSRRRRDTSTADDRQLTLDDLIERSADSELGERSASVASNNPDYQPAELTSFGADEETPEPMPAQTADLLRAVPGSQYLSNVIKGASYWFSAGQNLVSGLTNGPASTESPVSRSSSMASAPSGNVLHVDHRKSGCFFLPRSQGKCGSCYSFASIALYEFVYCKQTGDKVAFSEQYVVDCGGHISRLNGCDGGIPEYVGQFVQKYGLELRANYPYRTKQDICPYESNVRPANMGYLRAENARLRYVDPDKIDRFLAITPVQVDFKLKPDFSEYGGGIDDLVGCQKSDGHAMLVVGMGTENGKDYWLVRNSHGHNWGEDGYYRAAKNFDCLLNDAGVISEADFKNKPLVRKNVYNDNSVLKRRYAEYLVKEARVGKR